MDLRKALQQSRMKALDDLRDVVNTCDHTDTEALRGALLALVELVMCVANDVAEPRP